MKEAESPTPERLPFLLTDGSSLPPQPTGPSTGSFSVGTYTAH